MKITYKMVDPELRLPGLINKLVLRPSIRVIKALNWFYKKIKGKEIKGLNNKECWIESGEGNHNIRVRIHKPLDQKELLPGILYIHGGGHMLSTPEAEQRIIKELITTRKCVVVLPDYRLALEAPYPADLNDCYDTLLWMKKNAKELGIRSDQLVVYGGSAGGGLVSAICLRARDRGDVNIAFQMPLYPMLDDRMNTSSIKDNNAPVWSAKHNKLAWEVYLRNQSSEDIPYYAAPARATDLSGLPPAFSMIGDLDPFLDETVEYMKRLKQSGVAVEYKIFKGCYHAFERVAKNAEVSKEASTYIKSKFAYGIDHYFADQPSNGEGLHCEQLCNN